MIAGTWSCWGIQGRADPQKLPYVIGKEDWQDVCITLRPRSHLQGAASGYAAQPAGLHILQACPCLLFLLQVWKFPKLSTPTWSALLRDLKKVTTFRSLKLLVLSSDVLPSSTVHGRCHWLPNHSLLPLKGNVLILHDYMHVRLILVTEHYL